MTTVTVNDQPERLPRLNAAELKKRFAKNEAARAEVRLSLADILFGEDVIKNIDDGAEVVVKPVNFKGLALFEAEYGDLTKIPGEDVLRNSPRELCRVLTILVNQDLAKAEEKTEDEVGRVINAENMETIVRACMSAVRPTPASASGLVGAAQTGHA